MVSVFAATNKRHQIDLEHGGRIGGGRSRGGSRSRLRGGSGSGSRLRGGSGSGSRSRLGSRGRSSNRRRLDRSGRNNDSSLGSGSSSRLRSSSGRCGSLRRDRSRNRRSLLHRHLLALLDGLHEAQDHKDNDNDDDNHNNDDNDVHGEGDTLATLRALTALHLHSLDLQVVLVVGDHHANEFLAGTLHLLSHRLEGIHASRLAARQTPNP